MKTYHIVQVYSLNAPTQRKDVVRAFHAEAKPGSWTECDGRVGRQLRNEHSNSSITILPSVIEKVPVMLFAGDQDFICNYMGIESLIKEMEWSGEKGLGVSCLCCNLRFRYSIWSRL